MTSQFKIKLREELDFQDIRVKELAEKTQISQRTIEGYLSARSSMPPVDIAVKIAQALQVSVEYLVTGNKKNSINENTQKHNSYSSLIKEVSGLSENSFLMLLEMVKTLKKFDKVDVE